MARMKSGRGGVFFILLLILLAFLVMRSVKIVDPGTVQVKTLFGKVSQTVYGEGFHLVNPFASFHEMNIRAQLFDYTENNKAQALSADGTPLEVDTGFKFTLEPAYAWKVYQRLGTERRYRGLIGSSARESIRSAVAKYNWKDAATTKRDEMALTMRHFFEDSIVKELKALGFNDSEAQGAFHVTAVNLRRVIPPQKVLNAISEKVAAQEDLQRQKSLTAIAEEAARRRANEGIGVKRLFDELPKDFTASQIAVVLEAIANKERADAMMKAVEAGDVNVMVMNGNTVAVKP